MQQVIAHHQPWHQGGTENGDVADQELRIAVRAAPLDSGTLRYVNIQYLLYLGRNENLLGFL